MASVADFEKFLERCRLILAEHAKAAEELSSLPDSEFKRAMQEKFAEIRASAIQSVELAREALNRERVKLN